MWFQGEDVYRNMVQPLALFASRLEPVLGNSAVRVEDKMLLLAHQLSESFPELTKEL